MRVELVIGQVLRSVANGLMQLPQFSIHRELHKECFYKLVRVINPERLEVDRLPFARGF